MTRVWIVAALSVLLVAGCNSNGSSRAVAVGKEKIRQATNAYGKVSTKKYFEEVFKKEVYSNVR